MSWWTILALAGGCYAFKAVGPLVAPRYPRAGGSGLLPLLPPAVLTGLVAVQTFDGGRGLVLDERAAGVAVAVLAALLRAPFLVVVVAGGATTALLRALV